jgi:hypothetical protein
MSKGRIATYVGMAFVVAGLAYLAATNSVQQWQSRVNLVEPFKWVLLVAALVVWQRKLLTSLVERLSGLTVFGQRIELGVRINDAARWTESPSASITAELRPPHEEAEIMKLAARSPAVALARVEQVLAHELRLLAAGQGRVNDIDGPRADRWLEELFSYHGFQILRLIFDYQDLRDYLGRAAVTPTDRDRLVAIRINLQVLGLIEAELRETFTVKTPRIELYLDPACEKTAYPIHAVEIVTTNPDPQSQPSTVAHRTRQTHYTEGMRVSWEWRPFDFPDLYWIEPRTREKTLFQRRTGDAQEFVGHDMKDYLRPVP